MERKRYGEETRDSPFSAPLLPSPLLPLSLSTNLQFMDSKQPGAVYFVYSLVLTRGMKRVREDMGEYTSLVAAHGYCAQELVNLALTGRAVTNVFDGTKTLDGSMQLRGIERRADIGLLTLFEHFDQHRVGRHLKEPTHPIWVVCSESHYTVLFALDPVVVGPRAASVRTFDLFYYDELANQDEELKLTIDTNPGAAVQLEPDPDMVPPINSCIRTKWAGALVDWNGVEPIL